MARAVVVLLPGLAQPLFMLRYAARRLRAAGYATQLIGYPSRAASLEVLAQMVQAQIVQAQLSATAPLYFLTHSMGGLVLRCMQRRNPLHALGRVVMLGPPNGGSQLATRLMRLALYRSLMGQAAIQIGDHPEGITRTLGAVDFELGVIAGRSRVDPFALLLAGDSDGKVSLEETRVEGMSDWLCVEQIHTLLPVDPRVIDQAIHFFHRGRFARS